MADACLEDESYRGTTLIFILVVMVWQFYVVYKGVVIMWYLKKAKAFSMNASGITLMGSMLAPFFGTGVSASYALVLNRSDSEEYAIFDVLRPICFSIMSLLLIWATSTLSFMWLDILAKSNLSSDSKKYIPRIKRAHNFSVILTGIITVGGITQGRSDLAGAYQVLLCIYYTAAYKFGGSKLAKQLMPSDMSQSGSENAKQNAEKIKRVSNSHAITNSIFIIGMGLYVSSAAKYEGGMMAFLGPCVFLSGIGGMCYVCIDYVKFGSRKKLKAVGFKSKLSQIMDTMTSSGSDATENDAASSEANGA